MFVLLGARLAKLCRECPRSAIALPIFLAAAGLAADCASLRRPSMTLARCCSLCSRLVHGSGAGAPLGRFHLGLHVSLAFVAGLCVVRSKLFVVLFRGPSGIQAVLLVFPRVASLLRGFRCWCELLLQSTLVLQLASAHITASLVNSPPQCLVRVTS